MIIIRATTIAVALTGIQTCRAAFDPAKFYTNRQRELDLMTKYFTKVIPDRLKSISDAEGYTTYAPDSSREGFVAKANRLLKSEAGEDNELSEALKTLKKDSHSALTERAKAEEQLKLMIEFKGLAAHNKALQQKLKSEPSDRDNIKQEIAEMIPKIQNCVKSLRDYNISLQQIVDPNSELYQDLRDTMKAAQEDLNHARQNYVSSVGFGTSFVEVAKIDAEFYGYPKCCINDFQKNGELDDRRRVQKTISSLLKCVGLNGYIPCWNCARKIIHFAERLEWSSPTENQQIWQRFLAELMPNRMNQNPKFSHVMSAGLLDTLDTELSKLTKKSS